MEHVPAARLEVRERRLRVDEGAPDVHVHHEVVAVQRRLEHPGLDADARVVHQDVEPPEQGDCFVDAPRAWSGSPASARTNVTAPSGREPLHGLGAERRVPAGDHDGRALLEGNGARSRIRGRWCRR